MKIVVLAGGKGVRLWPLSHQTLPKQFLRLGNKHSLLQETLLRFKKEDLLIVTSKEHRQLVDKDLKEINLSIPILCEPVGRNTAPSVILAALYLKGKIAADEPILVVPSDHFISPQEKVDSFLTQINAWDKKGILLFGVRPTMPHTGYGYIELGKSCGSFFHVERFTEKPDLKTAKEYLISGNFLWNTGMFSFTLVTFFSQVKKFAPELLPVEEYASYVEHFSKLPNISLDYALLEKSDRKVVLPLDLSWSDVGSWDSLYEVMDKDDNDNVIRGNIIDIDTKNSLILGGKKLISTIGLKDIIVVETEEALFIAKKGSTQKVKDLVLKLREASTKKKKAPNKKPSQEYTK